MEPKVLLSLTGPGVARAERDAGGAWTVTRPLADIDVRCLAADPHHPGTVLAGTQGDGLLRSTDQGRTWQPAGMEGQIVKALAFSPSEPGLVLAGTKPPLIQASTDGGRSWAELTAFRRIPSRPFWRSPAEPPGVAYVQAIAISPTDPRLIVVGIEAGAVVRSTDGGQTWEGHRKGSVRDCHTLIFHSRDGSVVYEGGGSGAGAAISRDGGATWEQPRAGLDRHYGWAVAADPQDADTWYLTAAPGALRAHSPRGRADAFIYRHRNGAWEKLGGGLPQPLSEMPYALVADPAAPGHLYAGLASGEVWHSADCGDHWDRLPLQLPGVRRTLILLPT